MNFIILAGEWKGENIRHKHAEHIWRNIDLKNQKQEKSCVYFLEKTMLDTLNLLVCSANL